LGPVAPKDFFWTLDCYQGKLFALLCFCQLQHAEASLTDSPAVGCCM